MQSWTCKSSVFSFAFFARDSLILIQDHFCPVPQKAEILIVFGKGRKSGYEVFIRETVHDGVVLSSNIILTAFFLQKIHTKQKWLLFLCYFNGVCIESVED